MVVRKYLEIGSSKQVAGILASEVIESGKSDGWQGSLEELSEVEKILLLAIFAISNSGRGISGKWTHQAMLTAISMSIS